MNANDVIECYVKDVALLLPRKQRNDVAFELRALLAEELHARSASAGRPADADMAVLLVRAFGSPAEVASRYRPMVTIIDPTDGRVFARASIIGVSIIWCLGLIASFQHPIASGWDLLTVFGHWWMGTVIPSMWWPGVLVACFGLTAWARRTWPRSDAWKPRPADRIQGGTGARVLALIGVILGLSALIEPRWVLDIFWGGRAAPAAYEALTYTDTFRQRQAPWVFVLVSLNIPMFIALIINGRWSPMLRRAEVILSLALCAVLAWVVLDGPVFNTQASDQTFKLALVLIILMVIIDFGVRAWRRVKPSPTMPIPVAR